MSAPDMPEASASLRVCPISMAYMSMGNACRGSLCMAWRWTDSPIRYCEAADKPEGDGWEPRTYDDGTPRLAYSSNYSPRKTADGRPVLMWQRTVPQAERVGVCGMVPVLTVNVENQS